GTLSHEGRDLMETKVSIPVIMALTNSNMGRKQFISSFILQYIVEGTQVGTQDRNLGGGSIAYQKRALDHLELELQIPVDSDDGTRYKKDYCGNTGAEASSLSHVTTSLTYFRFSS
ncbi:hypothetical protein STEG23_001496, partial [Scotinomys teguina]